MKRIAAILLMIFYMIPALGFSITTHFCAGELANVSFFSQDETKCICGGKKMSSSCCSSNTTLVKIKDTQSKDTSIEISFVKNLSKLFYSFPAWNRANFLSFKSNLFFIEYPPDIPIKNYLYILNNVFRI